MFDDKIIWALSDDERRICQSNPLGKGVRQRWFLLGARCGRRSHCRIQHHLSTAQLDVLQEMRHAMPHESEQAVIDVQ